MPTFWAGKYVWDFESAVSVVTKCHEGLCHKTIFSQKTNQCDYKKVTIGQEPKGETSNELKIEKLLF